MSDSRPCHYYLQGNCKFGASCRFSHSDGGGHGNYYDDYQPKNNRNAGQQSYTNRNFKHGERGEDYRNTNKHEKNNYKYDNRSQYERNNYNNSQYEYGSRKNGYDQYDQKNYYYDNRNNKQNYNKKNNYYEEEISHEEESDYDNYNKNYNNDDNENRRKNNSSQKNYVNNSKENFGRKNSNFQYNNKHFTSKNDGYEISTENFKHDYQDNTTSNRYDKYSNDQYDNTFKSEQDSVSERDKLKALYANEIKVYQMQMKQMIENNYWPLTCYNPIGQSPIVEPIGCLNLMEASFEEIRCDYYSVKDICANPEVVHGQVYHELLLKSKKQKEDIINLKDFAVDDMIATFQKWKQAKTNSIFKNAIPVDKNIYWDMSIKRLKTPSDSKSLLDSFSFAMPDEVTGTKVTATKFTDTNDDEPNDTGPKILMQTEVYGRMENGFDQDHFIDYIPIMPPPEKYCH